MSARIDKLWTRFLAEGALSPSEERELGEALAADPLLADLLVADADVDGLLRGLSDERDEAFVRRFLGAVEAERDASRFVRAVGERVASPRRTRRSVAQPAASPLPWLVLAAAALLIAFLILRPSDAPSTPVAKPSKPVEFAPEPPPRPAPPPAPPPAKSTIPEPEPLVLPPPAPRSEPPKPIATPPPPPPRTVAVAAVFERAQGPVDVLNGGSVEGPGTLRFSDGTRLALEARTALLDIDHGRMTLAQGTLTATVPKLPPERALMITTPHGEARVLGTVFTLSVGVTTRLAVKEGRVRLSRASKSADVGPGQSAQAGPGVDPVASDRLVIHQWTFEEPDAARGWDLGSLDRTQTFNGSRGALKGVPRRDEDFSTHVEMAFLERPLPLTVTERTSFSFAYFVSEPGELKVQFRASRSPKVIVAHTIDKPVVGAWTAVTVRLIDGFRIRAGLGDLMSTGEWTLDQLQVHAGSPRGKADLTVDDIILQE